MHYNKGVAVKILIYTIAYVSLMSFGFQSQGVAEKHNQVVRDTYRYEQTAAILQILKDCPSPEGLRIPDTREGIAAKHRILDAMKRISVFRTDIVATAVKQYIAHSDGEYYSSEDLDKVYLLNRFLFQVPERVKRSEISNTFNYVIVGAPHDHGEINLMWPLRWGSDGHLELTDHGEQESFDTPFSIKGSYLWDEFKYFRNHYSRRTKY